MWSWSKPKPEPDLPPPLIYRYITDSFGPCDRCRNPYVPGDAIVAFHAPGAEKPTVLCERCYMEAA